MHSLYGHRYSEDSDLACMPTVRSTLTQVQRRTLTHLLPRVSKISTSVTSTIALINGFVQFADEADCTSTCLGCGSNVFYQKFDIRMKRKTLTSHEEEQPCHILHELVLFTAAQHTNDPAKQDDGDCHANETGCHSSQI